MDGWCVLFVAVALQRGGVVVGARLLQRRRNGRTRTRELEKNPHTQHATRQKSPSDGRVREERKKTRNEPKHHDEQRTGDDATNDFDPCVCVCVRLCVCV